MSNQSWFAWPSAVLGVCSVLFLSGCDLLDVLYEAQLDARLTRMLADAGFTGRIDRQVEDRLGRPIDKDLAKLGRLLFFDKIQSLHATDGDDAFGNPCAGCHDPSAAFGDSQPIAIGVDSNGIVGPDRVGPRNQRRAPFSVNAVFYPALMWTPRFVAVSGDPFDNTGGFQFTEFAGGNVTTVETLLMAQAVVAPTELVEMAGFTGTTGLLDPVFEPFDDGHGEALVDPSFDGIQLQVNDRISEIPSYQELFGDVFNGGVDLAPGEVTTDMRREAIGEFQATLIAANAPLDRFARGDADAMTLSQKAGAVLFFGKAGCVDCHAVAGDSNEMFSDFEPHRIGAPQVAPVFGPGTSNLVYDGPDANEDFGYEQTELDRAERYRFRTAPLRNLAMAPAYFHDGAFDTIEAAIRHHFDPKKGLAAYDAAAQGVPADLTASPFQGMLDEGLDPLLPKVKLEDEELELLAEFVESALLDPTVFDFCALVPNKVPSGLSMPVFQGCE